MTTESISFSSSAPALTEGRAARYVRTAARVLLGLGFALSGLSGLLIYFHAIPQPPGNFPAPAMAFSAALMNTHYLFQLLKGVELAAGILLLANRAVPFALVLLAPVLVNVVLFHAFLAPGEIVVPLVFLALELFLAWKYRAAFRPLFQSSGAR